MSEPRVVLFAETGMFGGEFYVEALTEGGITCQAYRYAAEGLMERTILQAAKLIVVGLVVDWIEPSPDRNHTIPLPSHKYTFYGFDLLEHLRDILGNLDRVAVMSTVTEELRAEIDAFQIPQARRLRTLQLFEPAQIRAAFLELMPSQLG